MKKTQIASNVQVCVSIKTEKERLQKKPISLILTLSLAKIVEWMCVHFSK